VLWFLTMVLASPVCPAVAQVSGRVLDSDSRPLPAVQVELWSESRRIAVQTTDLNGSFRFDGAMAAGRVRLSAHSLGYASVQREVSPPVLDLILVLVPAVIEVEGLTVVAAPRLTCPRREDREARDLWASLHARYDHSRDTLGISFYARRYDAVSRLDDVGLVDEGRITRSWYGVQGRVRRQNTHHTSQYWYAYPIHSSFDPAYAGWRYRDVQSIDVGHFLEETFGVRHTFSILARHKDTVVVGFCPARQSWKGPLMEGMLTIGRDTSLLRSEWKFRTPQPREEAGGEVILVLRGKDVIPLLPAQTLFWRRIIGQRDRYFYRVERFATYEFLPPDVLPGEPRKWLSEP